MIKADILLDSISPHGDRITTFVLTYPRFIHSELMTHRQFSRNAASSRAIPVEKMIQYVLDDPAMPIHWGRNQKGMQSNEELTPEAIEIAKVFWTTARDSALGYVRALQKLGLHKQAANRLLEAFFHITVLLTATEYQNFFALRAHGDAQPEFKNLAHIMLDQYNASQPRLVQPGDWHIPFADQYCEGLTTGEKLKVCTARAARVSYKTFEGQIDHSKDFDLHDKLKEGGHWSPFEHAARAMTEEERRDQYYLMTPKGKLEGVCGNFRGWLQYRKTFEGENRTDSRVLKK